MRSSLVARESGRLGRSAFKVNHKSEASASGQALCVSIFNCAKSFRTAHTAASVRSITPRVGTGTCPLIVRATAQNMGDLTGQESRGEHSRSRLVRATIPPFLSPVPALVTESARGRGRRSWGHQHSEAVLLTPLVPKSPRLDSCLESRLPVAGRSPRGRPCIRAGAWRYYPGREKKPSFRKAPGKERAGSRIWRKSIASPVAWHAPSTSNAFQRE